MILRGHIIRKKLQRVFYKFALAALIVLFLFNALDIPASADETPIELDDPILQGNSVELCLNSRFSQHGAVSGGDAATDEQISTVLWAAGMAPVTQSASTGEIEIGIGPGYIGTKCDADTKYYYSPPEDHSVTYKEAYTPLISEDFKVFYHDYGYGYTSPYYFDEGVSSIFALLASVSLRDKTVTQSALASCPRGQYGSYGLYFYQTDMPPLTSNLVAISSDGSLPDPVTDGNNDLITVMDNLKYIEGNNFTTEELDIQQISQLLWAGYGCNDHITSHESRAGLTVPSANATYYLTNTIYIVNADGVYRYQNRLTSDGGANNTCDHRIVKIKEDEVSGTTRAAVKAAGDLPEAPCYFILSLDYDAFGTGDNYWKDCVYSFKEMGFVAGSMLLQSSAIGLGCNFKSELTGTEQIDIQSATGIPSGTGGHTPEVVISVGGVSISSISITTDGEIDFGAMNLGDIEDTTSGGIDDPQTVEVTSGPVDLYIRTSLFSTGTDDWSLGTTNGEDQVIWKFKEAAASWTTFEVANAYLYPLASNVPTSGTKTVYFELTLPTATASTDPYCATVRITAFAPP